MIWPNTGAQMSADLPVGMGQLPIGMCGNALPDLVLSVLCNLGFITSLGKFLQRITNLTQHRVSKQLQEEICNWKTSFLFSLILHGLFYYSDPQLLGYFKYLHGLFAILGIPQ